MQSFLTAAKVQERCTHINDDECIVTLKYVVRVPVSWKFGSGSVLEVLVTINSTLNTIEHSWVTKVCGWDRCYVKISEFHSSDCQEDLVREFADYLARLAGLPKDTRTQKPDNVTDTTALLV